MVTKEIVDKYQQLERHKGTYGYSAQAFIDYLRENKMPVSDTSVESYIATLQQEIHDSGISASTYNSRVSSMKNIIKRFFMEDRGLTREKYINICKFLDEVKPMKRERTVDRDTVPTLEQYEKFIAECPDTTVKLVVTFLGYTGCRISEALGVLLSDVKTNHKFATITIRGKRFKERKIKISMKLLDEIKAHFKGKKWLFEHTGKQYSRSSMSARIKLHTLKILGTEFSAHMWRHYFATLHIGEGQSYSAVGRYMGHSNPSTTLDIYSHDTLSYEDLEVR